MTIQRMALTAMLGLSLALAFTQGAAAREQIHIVGSSTVFPFSTTVAERFGRSTSFKTPVVESSSDSAFHKAALGLVELGALEEG